MMCVLFHAVVVSIITGLSRFLIRLFIPKSQTLKNFSQLSYFTNREKEERINNLVTKSIAINSQ